MLNVECRIEVRLQGEKEEVYIAILKHWFYERAGKRVSGRISRVQYQVESFVGQGAACGSKNDAEREILIAEL